MWYIIIILSRAHPIKSIIAALPVRNIIKITGAAAPTYSSTDTGGNWFPDSRRAGITDDSVILMESQSCRIDIILYCPNMMSIRQFCGFMNPHCHQKVS